MTTTSSSLIRSSGRRSATTSSRISVRRSSPNCCLDLHELVDDDLLDELVRAEDLLQLGDQGLDLLVFLDDLVPLEVGQPLELHLQDGLGLDLGQLEPLHQAGPGLVDVLRGPDELDDGVEVVQGDGQALQDVGPGFGLLQVEPRPAPDDVLAVGDEVFHDVDQAERLGLLVDDGQHDDPEGGLEGRVLVEVVQDDLGQLALLDLDDDPDALPVGLVADVGDALDLLVVDQLGDVLDEPGLVDRVGDLGDDDPLALALVAALDHGLGPELDDCPGPSR